MRLRYLPEAGLSATTGSIPFRAVLTDAAPSSRTESADVYVADGAAFSPTHTRKRGKLYRYKVSQTALKHGAGSWPVGRVPAGEMETAVIDQLRAVFRQPGIVAGTWKAARHADDITEADARAALQQLDPLWDELFPAEQACVVTLLVERVGIRTDGPGVRFRVEGLGDLAREMVEGLGDLAREMLAGNMGVAA